MLSVKDEMCKCGEHAASISSSAIGSGRAIKKNSSLRVSGPNPSLRSRLPSQGLNTATEKGHYSSQHNTPVMSCRSVESDTVLSAVNIAGKPPESTPDVLTPTGNSSINSSSVHHLSTLPYSQQVK